MKGMVLDGLLEFIRVTNGIVFLEELLAGIELPSGGVYSGVGTYDVAEMETIVAAYSARAGVPRSEALRLFGHWIFPALMARYPAGHPMPAGTFELMRILHGVIHVEVHKLYPDAELPEFETVDLGADQLEVRYRSRRRLADFALGLMQGSIEQFGESIEIERRDHDGGTVFILARTSPHG